MQPRELAGKIAVVTGANHGIGAAVALALAREGADIFITFFRAKATPADAGINDGLYLRQREQDAEGVVTSVRALGVRAESIEADLSDTAVIPTLFDQAEAALGDVSILVNNAAAWEADTFIPPITREAQTWPPPQLINLISGSSIDRHFAINARAAALMMAEFARRHIARGASWGRIVNITTNGAACFPGEVSYGASKYALESYTRSAARELGSFGITANLVSPGPTQTGWITPDQEAEIIQQTPLRRIGQPEDVADAVALVVSQRARWLTGQILRASGGHEL